MAYQAIHWAWSQRGLNSTQKFVLLALADMADEQMSCFPGQDRLADMTGCSVETVRRAVRSLEDLDLIVREQRRGPDGFRTSDRYHMRLSTVTGQIDRLDSHRSNEGTSPVNLRNLTGQSEGVSTSVNHQLTPSENNAHARERSRATRLAPDWVPSVLLIEYTHTKAPSVDIELETEKFRNYWIAVPGRQGLKLDWAATWRGWVLRAHQENLRRGWKPDQSFGLDEWMDRA